MGTVCHYRYFLPNEKQRNKSNKKRKKCTFCNFLFATRIYILTLVITCGTKSTWNIRIQFICGYVFFPCSYSIWCSFFLSKSKQTPLIKAFFSQLKQFSKRRFINSEFAFIRIRIKSGACVGRQRCSIFSVLSLRTIHNSFESEP